MDKFLVYWASRENFGAEKQRIYCSRTKDFKTFTEPRVYIERDNHVIDTTIIEEKGKYYRFSKDETTKSIIAEVSDDLMGEFTNLETNLKNVFGVEGPACFKMKDENRWCLLLDHFVVEHKYFPYYTTDLDSAQFTINTKEFYIPVDAKHGGVMTITMDEYNALVKAYGNKNANPVLPSFYADPGINVFGDRFYIYPTSDGFEGWSGTYFKVFSSPDLVNWTDHGVILDLPTQIPWGTSRAWAPYAVTRNGKYYFYFCADTNIGVAVSDSPLGPFTDPLGKPLVAAEEIKAFGEGQAIDPMVFIDDDGQAYLYFGNCNLFVAKLNDDMISLKTPLKKITPNCFREAIDVLKKDDTYYFTWSDDDTRSENYHVNYSTSKSPMGPINGCDVILEKDLSLGIKGTGHHSIVKVPNRDEYYIAYHRFSIPDGDGIHREVCIDKLEFNEDGTIKKVKPTLEGIIKPIKLD